MAAIGIVGTGAWGTTLAIITARRGHQVRLLARTESEALTLTDDGEQSRFLPGVPFPKACASPPPPPTRSATPTS